MKAEARFVFDTNTIISALLFSNSIPRQAFDAARKHGKLLLSQPVIEELANVLARPKFDRYVTSIERFEFLAALIAKSDQVTVTVSIAACRDPKDNKFLELLVSGNGDCLVTGDQDLLILHPYNAIPILTATDFVAREWVRSED